MELGGAQKNQKSLFPPMDFFGNFSRSRGSQRGNYPEEIKKYCSGAKNENYRGRRRDPTLAKNAAHASTLS